MVNWKNYLIVFGGESTKRAVQRYNILTGNESNFSAGICIRGRVKPVDKAELSKEKKSP